MHVRVGSCWWREAWEDSVAIKKGRPLHVSSKNYEFDVIDHVCSVIFNPHRSGHDDGQFTPLHGIEIPSKFGGGAIA